MIPSKEITQMLFYILFNQFNGLVLHSQFFLHQYYFIFFQTLKYFFIENWNNPWILKPTIFIIRILRTEITHEDVDSLAIIGDDNIMGNR